MVIHHQKKWPIPASILFHWTNCQLLHLRRSEIQGFTGFNQPGNLPADAQCCSPVTPTSTAICCTAQPWIEFSPCTKPHSSARSISFNVQCRWHALLSCPLPMWTLNVYNFCNIICTCTYIYIYTQYFLFISQMSSLFLKRVFSDPLWPHRRLACVAPTAWPHPSELTGELGIFVALRLQTSWPFILCFITLFIASTHKKTMAAQESTKYHLPSHQQLFLMVKSY